MTSCVSGTVTCNDNASSTTEITCNTIDDDCDPATSDTPTAVNWYLDADGDTYSIAPVSAGCSPGANYTTTAPAGSGVDCNDAIVESTLELPTQAATVLTKTVQAATTKDMFQSLAMAQIQTFVRWNDFLCVGNCNL